MGIFLDFQARISIVTVHILTDASPEETRDIENVCGQGSPRKINHVFPNASHGWCGWHRINQNFTNNPTYHASLCAVKSSYIMLRIEIDVIMKWLWYFVKHYLNLEEIELSTILMNFYVNEKDQTHRFGQIPEATCSLINQFLTKSFFVHGQKLFEGLFYNLTLMKRATGGKRRIPQWNQQINTWTQTI